MENSEVHYLTYDPDAMWQDMITAYIEAGGDVLYPGDEKEVLLRGVQQMLFLAFAGVDNALRMDSLRYAVGEYLDIYGEKRGCTRIPAASARATVQITFSATGSAQTIPAGTPLTHDGATLYALTEDVTNTGYAGTVNAAIQCTAAGSAGNALLSGQEMQFLIPQDGVVSVYCTASATGGQEREDDETYRSRIHTYGLTRLTTGPQAQYEALAKEVTSEILDARAIQLDDGKVGVYLLLKSSTGAAAIIQAVENALRAYDTRPLTDQVVVTQAEALPYTLNVEYTAPAQSNIASALSAAVDEYQRWQDQTIGQPFNPDKLMALLYQAGAVRVVWGSGSNFDDGTVEYTAIEQNQYCHGTVTLTAT